MFCRELVLVVVVAVVAVAAAVEADLELPLHSEPVNNIVVNSMKNKRQ